ncbi:MAG TPA: glycosyltransferase [Thermoplasmata archaeon]|nr:glycosyltransferase [Thermoplasmata archaeon]
MQSSVPGLGPRPTDELGVPAQVIVGGVVAHNDERRIQDSLRSLLTQELPPGVHWGRVWVVASGCTDHTVEIARTVATDDPRVSVVVEPERRGKAAAIRQVLRRAEGEFLVLLNSDAVAEPGAVSALLTKAAGKTRPFAVMGRPRVAPPAEGEWSSTMRWMWELHHELHLEMLEDGRGAHLSDELLLVSLPAFPWIEDGVINDGSYCAVWLRNHSGSCWYAPGARVVVDVPRNPGDHLRQRRRIHVGNAQVAARLGRRPTTALRFFLERPSRALRALRRSLTTPDGLRHLVNVLGWEIVAHALAAWDRLPPQRDHVHWSRIASPNEGPALRASETTIISGSDAAIAQRVRILLEVAREFRAGIPLDRLAELLPDSRLWSEPELEKLLAGSPELTGPGSRGARPAGTMPDTDPERVQRGIHYQRAAESLIRQQLAWLHPWIRCIGVTGSAAYGAPSAGDDLDFYVVTRSGCTSWFLLSTYLTLRLWRVRRRGADAPAPCFNYVVDDRRAPVEFAQGHGLLFAREALTARIVVGDEYYRGLLARAAWLGGEIPRLFARRSVEPGDTTPWPVPFLVRCLNAVSFLPLATFLQLVGLVRNSRARRRGERSALFRTLTSPNGYIFQSERFEELRRRYERNSDPHPAFASTGSTSRIPAYR